MTKNPHGYSESGPPNAGVAESHVLGKALRCQPEILPPYFLSAERLVERTREHSVPGVKRCSNDEGRAKLGMLGPNRGLLDLDRAVERGGGAGRVPRVSPKRAESRQSVGDKPVPRPIRPFPDRHGTVGQGGSAREVATSRRDPREAKQGVRD